MGNVRLAIQAKVQRALVAMHRGDRDGALNALGRAALLAVEGHYLRPFLQARGRIAGLVPELRARVEAERPGDGDLRRFADELGRRMAAGEPGETSPTGFSAREI